MSKKICFSSVLKQKRAGQNVLNKQPAQNSLRDLMDQFMDYPSGDFTLRYSNNSLKACNSKQGFEEGCNPLDQWIHSQKIHNNKENISDTQPRRQIPNELLKYANPGPKSPRGQVKPDLPPPQHKNPHRNADMKQICREYVENKKNGKDMAKDAPVWKFAARNSDQGSEEFQAPKRIKNFKDTDQAFRQEDSSGQIKFNQWESQAVKEQKSQGVKQNSHAQGKGQNLLKIVEQIKSNLVPQIEVMAERIIQQKALGQEEDQELLISQRESEEQRDQKRLDKARREIGQYLSMKSCASSEQRFPETASVPTRKPQDENIEKGQEKGSRHVGYSFSSDFQSQSVPQQSFKNDSYNHNSGEAMVKLKKQADSHLQVGNKISLPNIDEVKSERDAMERVQQYFEEPVPRKKSENETLIDKNYIKEIQSVAYVEADGEVSKSKVKADEQGKAEPSSEVEIGKKTSLFQQISKTAMSIQGLQENQVNISVAEGKQSAVKSVSQRGSAKNETVPVPTQVEVNAFVAPVQSVKIQLKKVPSPERAQKESTSHIPVAQTQVVTGPTSFSRVCAPTTTLQTTQPVFQNSSYHTASNYLIPKHKASFGNILQQTQKQQPSTVPSITPTLSNPSHVTVQAPPYQQQYQNSRERGNSLKNSNQEDQGRKLKITISPKYHGKEEDKYESVGHVADFRLINAKMEDSTEPKHVVSTVTAAVQPTGKSSISSTNLTAVASKQSLGAAKYKIDTMFTNMTTVGNMVVTQVREVHEERERGDQQGLMRVQKYERVEKVENSRSNKQSLSQKNVSSIKSSQQFEFDLDF